MSSQTTQLLDAFDALPAEKKRAFAAEFFRRVIPFDSAPLDDDETSAAADTLLAAIEDNDGDTPSCLGLAVRPRIGRESAFSTNPERRLGD